MAFVPGYRHDIFVSYATVDNGVVPGQAAGWVSTLIDHLLIKLDEHVGRRDDYSLFIDHQLRSDLPLHPAIFDAVRSSAILLIIMSRGYLRSKWCAKELLEFLEESKNRGESDSRIILVERTKVDDQDRPVAFDDLRVLRFWAEDRQSKKARILGDPRPDPNDPKDPYYDVANDLCLSIMSGLERLKAGGDRTRPKRAAVFLAEVTDDLDPRRSEIRRYLEAADLRVLPEVDYPRDPAAFRDRAGRDLSESKLFVQLLSDRAGKRTVDLPKGYLGLQLELARAQGLPILHWRSADLTSGGEVVQDHLDLLMGETTLAIGLEEFKGRILKHVEEILKPPILPPAQQPAAPAGAPKVVFVNSVSDDLPLARNLGQMLSTRWGAWVHLPQVQGTASALRKDLKEKLSLSKGLILIYDRAKGNWISEQLRWALKTINDRGTPLRIIGIYEHPPLPKDPLDQIVPNLKTLHGPSFDERELQAFVDAL